MSWKEPGSGGPWGGGRGPWGRGSGGPTPPDFDELFRKGQERVRRFLPGGFGRGQGYIWAVIAILVVWVLSGFYTIAPDEVGVVLRFGAFDRITQPGLNYHLPNPLETVIKTPVTRINKIELGYRASADSFRRGGDATANESLMLTGDQNIVDINFSVFWQIKNPEEFLFDIRDPELTVKVVAESAMREVIGQLPITAPLYESRTAIAQRTQTRMQELLDQYKAGVSVVQVQLLKADPPAEVIDAFNDVQRAKADQERASNEADAYRNGIVPVARGDAARIVQEAAAYKEQVVDLAQGDAQRFLSVLSAYKQAPNVTAQRLYIETLEDVLKNAQKVVIDPQAKGLVPYLPLPELGKPRPAPATPPAASSMAAPATGATK
ncbi:MAG TPA: FtsH protease activity modulator HflK [Magnetospirillaceae bacterium]|jgi:membrane protease subunit HflK